MVHDHDHYHDDDDDDDIILLFLNVFIFFHEWMNDDDDDEFLIMLIAKIVTLIFVVIFVKLVSQIYKINGFEIVFLFCQVKNNANNLSLLVMGGVIFNEQWLKQYIDYAIAVFN